MKVAAVSMRVKHGRCEENFRQMCRYIDQAKRSGARLIVFPQNALSGLQLKEMWLDEMFCRYADSYNARIAALADTIAIIWGNIRYRGGRRFNTAFFAYQDQIELRVKQRDGALDNDARYFDELEVGELIEYEGEFIAIGFHERVYPASLNITLDFTERSIEPREISQIYVNAAALIEDARGIRLSDGRCFCTRGGRLVQFSEYEEGCHLAELSARAIPRPQALPALKQIESLMDAVMAERGAFALYSGHEESRCLAWLLQRPQLLEMETGTRVYGTRNDDPRFPSLLCGFSLPQLVEAGIYPSLAQAGLTLLYADLYQRTHSLRGICRMLLQEDSVHPALQKMRSDPDAFIDDLLMRMIHAALDCDELCLDEAYRRYLAEDLRQWLRKIS